ncbi:MAG TPA: hypothetical protein VI339_01110 [Steroidobacteraceae bacterium]|nr:hypothetical protein [Steroidobacteraceae bacterium]
MNLRNTRWLAALLAGLLVAGSAFAQDTPPETGEKCIEQCDIQSDECMADADADSDKQQACDDRYSECLAACK